MRKLLFVLLVCLGVSYCYAEKVVSVIVHEKDGTTAFALEKKPKISFTQDGIKLTTIDTEIVYSIQEYLKITMEESDSSQDGVIPITGEKQFFITRESISSIGLKANSIIYLYTIDGKRIRMVRTDENGKFDISLRGLPKGVYVLSSESKSIKIYTK